MSSFRTGTLHAIIVAGLISQLIMGPYLYFGYPKIETFLMSQVVLIIGVSIIVGFITALFGQSLKLVVIYRARLSTTMKKAIFSIICGLIFAAFAIFVSMSELGSGKELLNRLLFDGKHSGLLDVFSRFFGSAVTYAVGGAGSIFAPTLSICGAAALSALTHSPFTSFVLILEMTDRHNAIFPLIIAALIGQRISKFVSKDAFYHFACTRILTDHEATSEKEGKSYE